MTMRRLQDQVRDFVQTNDLEIGIGDRLLDVVSELGEVAKEALRATQYGTRRFVRGDDWEDELGDVVFSLICVANASDVDLESALQRSLLKYGRRVRSHGHPGSSAGNDVYNHEERISDNG